MRLEEILRNNPELYEDLNNEIRNDPKLVSSLINENESFLIYITEAQKNNQDFVKSLLKEDGLLLKFFKNFNNNKELVKEALNQNVESYIHINKDLSMDEDCLIKGLQNNKIKKIIIENIKSDYEKFIKLGEQNEELLDCMMEKINSLKKCSEIVLLTIEKSSNDYVKINESREKLNKIIKEEQKKFYAFLYSLGYECNDEKDEQNKWKRNAYRRDMKFYASKKMFEVNYGESVKDVLENFFTDKTLLKMYNYAELNTSARCRILSQQQNKNDENYKNNEYPQIIAKLINDLIEKEPNFNHCVTNEAKLMYLEDSIKVSKNIENEKDELRKIVGKNRYQLLKMSDELKNDKEFALEMLKLDGLNMYFFGDEIKKDYNLVREAMNNHKNAYIYCDEEIVSEINKNSLLENKRKLR